MKKKEVKIFLSKKTNGKNLSIKIQRSYLKVIFLVLTEIDSKKNLLKI